MFYLGSTFELFVELVDPKSMSDSWIKDPAKDGLLWNIFRQGESSPIHRGVLGNKDWNSYASHNFMINTRDQEGVYYVCLGPSDGIFYNAGEDVDGIFGKVFQKQDFSKI